MAIDLGLFKAYDIRATVDRLTPEAARLIGHALGSEAQARGFARFTVGRDGRLSSPALAAALIEGLVASGITVCDLGLAATPLLNFQALQASQGCGAVVTGSHNPPQYNGIKIMLGGEAVGGDALLHLARRIEAGTLRQGVGSVTQADAAPGYIAALAAAVPQPRALSIVVDCGNGVPGALAPALYRALGHAVHPLFCEVDGRFPHHHPDPQQPENLVDLQRAVLQHGAAVGLAFDGDGDRLGVVTRSGRIVPGDRLLALFAAELLAKAPGGLVLYDVKSSRVVARQVAAAGGHSLAIPTGHTHMKRELKARAAVLAGELSGHYAFAGWWMDDALYAGARLLALLGDGLDLDAVLEALPTTHATPELQIPITEPGGALVARIAAHACFDGASAVSTVDGLRIEYPDGFGLIRASNTTPVLTLRAEGDTPQALQRIRSALAAAIAPLPLP
ncbi:phosphomannomutase/phosphoglucomutase [Chitiniphilus purpureus]|uniref:Phosphomannomutase/phosphoglucomutase n=1 Tax=Chitiniphilus purpureus TaxID=2981137 RepID=A0ABY6DSN6_9NEIS|nr:phosphomannomutase/phosphoglucomutase [Chitiniphilus sp. CD1]UXY14908.1 phosphomannomutase/phosphoglucomutase [Chitiniphilus sp. CD1]